MHLKMFLLSSFALHFYNTEKKSQHVYFCQKGKLSLTCKEKQRVNKLPESFKYLGHLKYNKYSCVNNKMTSPDHKKQSSSPLSELLNLHFHSCWLFCSCCWMDVLKHVMVFDVCGLLSKHCGEVIKWDRSEVICPSWAEFSIFVFISSTVFFIWYKQNAVSFYVF